MKSNLKNWLPMINRLIILSAFISLVPLAAQERDFLINPRDYPFVNFDSNKIVFPGDCSAFEKFYEKLDSLILFGEGKITIVHLGGSHVQADIYTHEIRKRLQNLQFDMNGGRGMIFPFRIAHTNNPENYRISYKGNWEYCKSTQFKSLCNLGLSGIAVYTGDKEAGISINPNLDEEIHYSFTRVKIFHALTHYKLTINVNKKEYSGIYDTLAGCSVFEIPEGWTLNLHLKQSDSIPDVFTLYGISLETDNPGIVYNALGVNGAKISSFLNCGLYSRHLSALNPDLLVFSIGTNDGNTPEFNQKEYRIEYERLIEISKLAAPNAIVIITVPNDCYLYKRQPNNNTALMREEIYKIAVEHNYGVWDFYTIMGGLNSSKLWHENKLMRDDRIHFTEEGYLLNGDLFVTAFLKAWENNLVSRTSKYISTINRDIYKNNYELINK